MRSLIRNRKTLHIALLQIVLAAVVFAMAVPTSAMNISSGEYATYSFDFTITSHPPPYDGYRINMLVDTNIDPVSGSYSFRVNGFDTAGGWNLTGPALAGNGFADSTDDTFYIERLVSPELISEEDGVQFLKIIVDEGVIDVKNIELGLHATESGRWLPSSGLQTGELVATGAVPEPTTMLLFGAGLVGLAGFGRKRFKK